MAFRTFTKKRFLALVAVGLAGVMSYVLAAQIVVSQAAGDAVVSDAGDLTPANVVIVPGARVYPNGTPSQFLRQRLNAADELYEAGTVEHVLVSGDNRQSHYNEPEAMQEYIVDQGVYARDVTLDFAGFDTWDTCIRAKEQFGVTEAIVVTQERFADRTAALCSTAGIEVQVLALRTPYQSRGPRLKSNVREKLANVKAWGDIVRTPDAHHGGEFVGLIGSEPS